MSSVLSHKGCRWIALGWAAFIAENIVLSELKEDIVEKFGLENYRLTYSTLSTAACGSIAYGYLAHGRQQGPMVTSIARRFPLAVFTIQALGLAGISCLALPKLQIPFGSNGVPSPKNAEPIEFTLKCPVDFKAGKTDLKEICRYPMLFSFGFATMGTSLAASYMSLRLLTAFPTIMAVIGSVHQDRRYLRSGELDPVTYEKTSLLPFVALIQNGGWVELAEKLPWVNISAGVLIALGLARRRMIILKPSKLPQPLA